MGIAFVKQYKAAGLDKTIPLSAEVREWLGVEEKQMMPNELIRALLDLVVDGL